MNATPGLGMLIDAVILRPFYPVSRFYRPTSDATGLQADFMPVIHGVRSFESLRSRAVVIDAGEARVATRKRKAGEAANRRGAGAAARDARARAALAAESDRQLDALIRRRLALPVEARMNFLRRRPPGAAAASSRKPRFLSPRCRVT